MLPRDTVEMSGTRLGHAGGQRKEGAIQDSWRSPNDCQLWTGHRKGAAPIKGSEEEK